MDMWMHVHGIKARKEKQKTLILHVKDKQTIKQENRDSKTYKWAKIEAYDTRK